MQEEYGDENELVKYLALSLDYAERHRKMIERFGRFPHRNEVLGRPPTAEEIQAEKDGTADSFF